MVERLTIDGTEARLFQVGIRCNYYITADGGCWSLTKGRLAKLRKLKACVNGHKNPTIRVKVLDGGVVVVRNLPIYRIVYDIYSGVYHDWNVCKIKWIDGNPLNYSYENMSLANLKKYDDLDVAKICDNRKSYEMRFDSICAYICHRFELISIDDAKDVASEAYFYLCRKDAEPAMNFEAYWTRAAFRLSQKFVQSSLRRVQIEDRTCYFEPNYDYCNISIYDIGLTELEKSIVDMLIKGYSLTEAINSLGYKYHYQCPTKLYHIVEKFKKSLNE